MTMSPTCTCASVLFHTLHNATEKILGYSHSFDTQNPRLASGKALFGPVTVVTQHERSTLLPFCSW